MSVKEAAVDEILLQEQAICDPHHHLWDYPESMYLVDEFLADVSHKHKLDKTVYVECRRRWREDGPEHLKPVGETEFIEGTVETYEQQNGETGVAAGIVGFADLTLGGDVDEVLDAHAAASDRFRGIRYMTAWHASDQLRNAQTDPTEKLLEDDPFLKGFGCLDKRGLSFDAWVYHPQINEVGILARAFPGVNVILNHIGGPVGVGPYKRKRDAVFADWSESISRLAEKKNVFIKLGGLTMALSGFGWNKADEKPGFRELSDTMGPWYRFCIDTFGADRCMFESNFPIDRVSCSYTTLWNAFKDIASNYSPGEREKLLHGTAVSVYRL